VSDGPVVISSTANPLVKRIRALRRRKDRERERAFFVDGIQPVWRALDHGASVETLVVAPDLLTSEAARGRVEAARAAGIAVATVTPAVYQAVSERDGPSGLGAIVALPDPSLDQLRITKDSIVAALDEISGPGNLGTIVRTADGAGATAVVVVGDAADPFDPAAVKASMGTIFSVPVVRARSLDDLFAWASDRDLNVVTTSARASTPYFDAGYRLPALLVLGSEREGLSEDALARGDVQVRIDMEGAASSLNVAVAAGILLFELRRATSR
jgi:TrmH family RNA methyltransferase